VSGDLLPEGGFLRGQKRILAGVPAKKMLGARVCGVVLAALPNFVEKECSGLIGAAMQVVLQTAFFFACGHDQGAELGFEKQVLAFLRTECDDQGKGTLGKFSDFGARGLAA
jgi:hypothetical protein